MLGANSARLVPLPRVIFDEEHETTTTAFTRSGAVRRSSWASAQRASLSRPSAHSESLRSGVYLRPLCVPAAPSCAGANCSSVVPSCACWIEIARIQAAHRCSSSRKVRERKRKNMGTPRPKTCIARESPRGRRSAARMHDGWSWGEAPLDDGWKMARYIA